MKSVKPLLLGLVLVSLAGVSWGDLTRDEGSCVFVDWAEHVSKKRESGAENEPHRFQN